MAAKRKSTSKNWMQKAFSKNKGQLHRDLGIAQDKVIPLSTLVAASKRKGKVGQRARAALNARRANTKNRTTRRAASAKRKKTASRKKR